VSTYLPGPKKKHREHLRRALRQAWKRQVPQER
jgi:hypothetical protein